MLSISTSTVCVALTNEPLTIIGEEMPVWLLSGIEMRWVFTEVTRPPVPYAVAADVSWISLPGQAGAPAIAVTDGFWYKITVVVTVPLHPLALVTVTV